MPLVTSCACGCCQEPAECRCDEYPSHQRCACRYCVAESTYYNVIDDAKVVHEQTQHRTCPRAYGQMWKLSTYEVNALTCIVCATQWLRRPA